MVLTLDQWDLSPTSSPPALIGPYGSHGLLGQTGASGAPGGPVSREWPAQFIPSSSSSSSSAALLSQSSTQSPSPSPSQTLTPSSSHGPPDPSQGSPSAVPASSCASTNPQLQGAGHRLGSKPSSLGLGAGADKRSGSPSSVKSAQQQPVTAVNSPSTNVGNSSNNSSGAILSTAALQAHQHQNRTNGGVTLYPYQVSFLQMDVSVCLCALVLSDTQSYFYYKGDEVVAVETEH